MSITLRLIAFALLFGAAVLFASAFRIESSSSAQNANSSTTTNRNQNSNQGGERSVAPGAPAPAQQPDFSKNTWELPDDADKTKNPVPSTPESIAKGKELYFERTKGNCVFCHGDTGAGNEANFPRLRRKPADLTNKERMTAMTDGEVFWKITKGITGIMPAGENRMKDPEERWHVVNYIRTLAKDSQ